MTTRFHRSTNLTSSGESEWSSPSILTKKIKVASNVNRLSSDVPQNRRESRSKCLTRNRKLSHPPSGPIAPIFRITYGQGNGPSLLRTTLLETGLVEFNPECHREDQWSFWWKGFRFKQEEFSWFSPTQRVNHHPSPVGNQADITKKDGLLRAVRSLCAAYPKCASLIQLPVTFNLPREERQFISLFCQNAVMQKRSTNGVNSSCALCLANCCSTYAHRHLTNETNAGRNIWIVKPTDMSRGRGIHLFDRLEDFVYATKSVVQQYIPNPLLIAGHKFDLRLYAVVPSYAPFIVYIFADGLVRFASERFDLDNLHNVYSHLTNSSINVNGPGYLINKKGIGRGCKWSLRQLQRWMSVQGMNTRMLWQRIKAIIILTLLSQATNTPKVKNACELFGFDILIDNHLRPWLIEVNSNPSLSNDCAVDETVKKPLITSIIQMLRLNETPTKSLNLIAKSMRIESNLNNNMSKPEAKRANSKDDKHDSEDFPPPEENNLMKLGKEKEDCELSETTSDSENYNITLSIEQELNDFPLENLPLRSRQKYSELHYSSILNKSTQRLHGRAQRDKSRLRAGFRFPTGSTEDAMCFETCPLYGPGSQALLSQLQLLGKRYADLVDSRLLKSNSLRCDTRTCNNSVQHCNPRPPSVDCLSSKSTKNGCFLIPHSFGQLKLAFPFNLITRIACAKECNGYPDQKLVVRQLIRQIECETVDSSQMDIADVWGDVT